MQTHGHYANHTASPCSTKSLKRNTDSKDTVTGFFNFYSGTGLMQSDCPPPTSVSESWDYRRIPPCWVQLVFLNNILNRNQKLLSASTYATLRKLSSFAATCTSYSESRGQSPHQLCLCHNVSGSMPPLSSDI